MKYLASLLVVTACGGGSSNNGGGADAAPDSRVWMDAPPSVPAMITIGGTAGESTQTGSTPLAGVAISIFKVGDDNTPLGTATSDAQGKYAITIPTSGHVVDAYVHASKSGYVDNDSFPAAPFQADVTDANANMITTSNYGFLKLLGGGHDGNAVVVVEVLDVASMSVAGATVASTPAAAAVKYSDSNGTPTATMSTAADGVAFLFDVTPGHVDVSAMKTGMTFKTHGLAAHADRFTTTVVTP